MYFCKHIEQLRVNMLYICDCFKNGYYGSKIKRGQAPYC